MALSAAAVLLVVLVSGLGLLDARAIQRDLAAARRILQSQVQSSETTTPGGRQAVSRELVAATARLDSAGRRARRSPALWLAWIVPGLHRQRAGLVSLIDDSRAAVLAGRELLGAIDGLAGQTQLREGAVPLSSLGTFQVEMASASQRFGSVVRRPSGLWSTLRRARRTFDRVAASTSERLGKGADGIGAARGFLAEGGERRYLLALQNNAEMRDQGAVLSYAVARVAAGRISFEPGGSVGQLDLDRPAPTPVPDGTRQVFGSLLPTQQWPSVNATADFAWSGRAMVDMYRQRTGQPLDGVIGIDVPAMAALLRAVGPVAVAGVTEPVTADNVARLLLHDFYAGLAPNSDQSARREKQGEVAVAVIDRLTHGTSDAVTVGRQLGDAAAGGHLRLWSAAAPEERVFERNGLGGGPALALADRSFHVAVENRSANKLDYYVKPSVSQQWHLNDQGDALVQTTIVIDNQAPPGPPSYQLGPDAVSRVPGNYVAWVLLWAPAGSLQLSGGVDESGLMLAQRVIDVGPGQRREVSFQTVVPRAVRNGGVAVRWVAQPRLEAAALEVDVVGDGWNVTGARWRGPADRTRTLTWKATRKPADAARKRR